MFSLLILTLVVAGSHCQSNTGDCTYLGNLYQLGDAWVDDTGCDVCECNQYGVQCKAGLDGEGCQFNSSIAKPGDPACLYGYFRYLVGNRFKALDGCNTCLCTATGMQCTAKACDPNGFVQPSTEPLYGDCEENGLWYPHQSQWLADDGCNTCYCAQVGNYRGWHVCTTNKCGSAHSNTNS